MFRVEVPEDQGQRKSDDSCPESENSRRSGPVRFAKRFSHGGNDVGSSLGMKVAQSAVIPHLVGQIVTLGDGFVKKMRIDPDAILTKVAFPKNCL